MAGIILARATDEIRSEKNFSIRFSPSKARKTALEDYQRSDFTDNLYGFESCHPDVFVSTETYKT